MLSTRYFIQATKVNKKGQTVVMLDLNWQGHRLRLGTSVLINPANFVNTDKKLLATAEPNALALNWKLKQLALDVQRDYLLLEGQTKRVKEITPDLMRALVQNLLGTAKPEAATTPSNKGTEIWALHDEWKDVKRHKDPQYLRKYEPVKKYLPLYEPHLTLEMLDERWVQGYVNWLLETTTLRNGSLRSHILFFRAMLKFGRRPYEWLDNPFKEYTPGVDLTYQEVLRMHRAVYFLPELRQTADAYVFLCHVGLRFGDYLQLEKVETVEVGGQHMLVILDQRQSKTKQAVTVPLAPLAASIWTTYKGALPKCTNQEFNRRIKQVARIAGLNRIVEQVTMRGNVATTTQRPLYEIISAHTARHTCASLLLEGSGGKELSQLTLGQNDRKSTDIYARPKVLKQITETTQAWENLGAKHAATPRPGKPRPATR